MKQKQNNTKSLQEAATLVAVAFTTIQAESPKITKASLPEFCRAAAERYNLPDADIPEMEERVRALLAESASWINNLQITVVNRKPCQSFQEMFGDLFGAKTKNLTEIKGQ